MSGGTMSRLKQLAPGFALGVFVCACVAGVVLLLGSGNSSTSSNTPAAIATSNSEASGATGGTGTGSEPSGSGTPSATLRPFPTETPRAPGPTGASGATGATGSSSVSAQQEPTKEGLRVAFIGDQGLNTESEEVLELIASEQADLVFILGDFDYDDEPDTWDAMLEEFLGNEIPIIAVVGNHDVAEWDAYQEILEQRIAAFDEVECSGDFGVTATCRFGGIFFVLSGIGTLGDDEDHEDFIAEQLAQDDTIWQICGWHKNQEAMQVGDKSDSVGWFAYETCREHGAIIATAHEHSYSRTKTLVDMEEQEIDPAWPDGKTLRVARGSTFAFVSGLGGNSIRDQERCAPEEPPYGCNGEWAMIYAEEQDANAGALFIDFFVDDNPRLARGYFKNIDGDVVDQFTITSER